MVGTRVRTARNVDVPAIEDLVVSAFAPFVARTGIRPAPLGTDWPTVISALGASVATRDDRVVGVLVAWPHPDAVLVELLAVAPAEQGSGVGGMLLAEAERQARQRGSDVLRLYTNAAMTEALAWYPRRGFVETARRTEEGYHRVHLEKRLP